jgi:hypothetical protein
MYAVANAEHFSSALVVAKFALCNEELTRKNHFCFVPHSLAPGRNSVLSKRIAFPFCISRGINQSHDW